MPLRTRDANVTDLITGRRMIDTGYSNNSYYYYVSHFFSLTTRYSMLRITQSGLDMSNHTGGARGHTNSLPGVLTLEVKGVGGVLQG